MVNQHWDQLLLSLSRKAISPNQGLDPHGMVLDVFLKLSSGSVMLSQHFSMCGRKGSSEHDACNKGNGQRATAVINLQVLRPLHMMKP